MRVIATAPARHAGARSPHKDAGGQVKVARWRWEGASEWNVERFVEDFKVLTQGWEEVSCPLGDCLLLSPSPWELRHFLWGTLRDLLLSWQLPGGQLAASGCFAKLMGWGWACPEGRTQIRFALLNQVRNVLVPSWFEREDHPLSSKSKEWTMKNTLSRQITAPWIKKKAQLLVLENHGSHLIQPLI